MSRASLGNVRGRLGRSGFTLVELLVVITVIGILTAIAVPVLSGVRERTRQAQCELQLHNLGVAAHNFCAGRGCFPPGYLGPLPQAPTPPHNGQFISSLTFLLPFLGHTQLYREIDADKAGGTSIFDSSRQGTSYWMLPSAWRIGQYRFPEFVCPSANPYDAQETFATVHFFLRTGAVEQPVAAGVAGNSSFNTSVLGRTNYLGSAGAVGRSGSAEWDRWAGVFYNRSQIGPSDIIDGAAATFLFGEACGGTQGNGTTTYGFSWIGCGALGTYWGLDTGNWQSFGSHHPGITQFCMADNSVRRIRFDIDQQIYVALSGIRDQQPASVPEP